ncbi:unnamed protein product [Sphagnum jensenii]|uniref:Uncharacterized protein n=1 Tax=Sphagnum jensenii TaxID=128206 RepID=A0ABP1B8L1_9BRYO
MSQEAAAAAASLWRSQFSQLSSKQRMALLGALAISSVLLLIMYTSRTSTTTTRKQHSSSSDCRSKAHAAYKQFKKKKKDEEETFFFGLLKTSKSGAIYIRGIHDAIDDEERDEADESDDEQEDCEADEEEEDDAAASPEVEEEEEEKSDPDLDAASTFFFTPVEGESDDDDDARNALECESARTSFCLPSAVDVFQDGPAPANVHRMGEAFFEREDMELPIWPSVSPNVRRQSAWKTLYYVCILYASTSVMKW